MLGLPTHCEHCSGTELRVSRSAKYQRLAKLVFLYPIRCTHCDVRFWRFTFSPPYKKRGSQTMPALTAAQAI